ncbi:glycerol kinase GlpK [candidate division KSB1 bacterium]|nr:glycerol kinase GlpK [candidate division KSB1 bacterium]
MPSSYILALDQGTTSSRAILFDRQCKIVATAQQEFKQYYPKPGWVEHDAEEIWQTQLKVAREVLGKISPQQIAAIGITNQRETTVVWDKRSGKPVHHAIVWQCRRTADICEQLKQQGLAEYIQKNTGLVIDAYFSATKVKWILDNVPGIREKAENGDLLFGTIDSWLVWNLSGGELHVTDYTNASRTMLYNCRSLGWDKKLTKVLGIPLFMLPRVMPCSAVYGKTAADLFDAEIPIAGMAGDQQSALFGQGCFDSGDAKNTYGTGCFLVVNTGENFIFSRNGLLTTIGFGQQDKVEYSLEGSVFVAGAAIQWLRDELKLIGSAPECDRLAEAVADSNGVYMVPAFTGLGAPYWDMYARGTIVGLTRGVNRNHLARATLEAIAYQTRDVLEAVQQDAGMSIDVLRVDGGAAVSDFLMQFQADILGIPVERPKIIETTALGAAFLAGLAVGFWKNEKELTAIRKIDRIFEPSFSRSKREELYGGWKRAVERARGWERK